MKFKLTFKTPDVTSQIGFFGGFFGEKTRDEVDALIKRWVEYDEYLTVEFDTEAKTCSVVPL